MNLSILKDRIHGCQLKMEYLEAFLLQGAYIEGIIKQLVDLWVYIQMNKKEEKNEEYSKFREAIMKRTRRYGLYDMIEILFDMGNINEGEKKKMHNYRESRNEVVHSLLTKIKDENLNNELLASLKIGDEIMSTPQFTNLERIIIEFEKGSLTKETGESKENKN